MDASELTAPGNATGLAATVVLLRDFVPPNRSDASPGVEVLLLERPHDRGSFAGAWVFPGGAVDIADAVVAGAIGQVNAGGFDAPLLNLTLAHEEAAARHAAIRETAEETGLRVDEAALVPLSRWHPPHESPKRLRTWFYVAAHPGGQIALEPAESVSSRWIAPDAALAAHAAGELRLMPPTWVTLWQLQQAASVAEVMQGARGRARAEFATHMVLGGAMTLWHPDVAYGEMGGSAEPELLDAPGPRHRLDMRRLPWQYLRP